MLQFFVLARSVMLSLMFICATLTGCLGEKNSEDLGGVGDYTVTWNQKNFRSIEGTEFMDDGGNLTLKFVLDADDVMEEGYTHYLVEFIVKWNETDEVQDPNGPQEQASCVISINEMLRDQLTASLYHDEIDEDLTVEGTNNPGGDGIILKHRFSKQGWTWARDIAESSQELEDGTDIYYISNYSESQLVENLSVGSTVALGEYTINLNLETITGGDSSCPHNEQGEEVNYRMNHWHRKLSIEPTIS